jgi:2,5-furandicarboxylate decarboxylase 1
MTKPASAIDFDKYRLRNFVDRLIELGEVAIHDEPVPLTAVSSTIEATSKAVLFKKAGPEHLELVAKTAGNRRRIAAAFGTSEDKLYEEYFKRLADHQPLVEVPSADAPVHAVTITGKDVDLTKLPFHPQHAYDGSCYISSAIDYTIDPATGRRNVRTDDGREVACALDDLRQTGKLGRDRDGRYYLAQAKPGSTGIVGQFYHDPNEGA